MSRFAPVLVVLVTLLAGCNAPDDPPAVTPTPVSPSPPPPPEPPTEGAIVSHVNDTWSYRGDSNESVVSTVTGANSTVVRLRTVSQRADAAPHTSLTLFDARTLAVLSIQDDAIGAELRFDPPLPILIPAEDHAYNGSLIAVTPFGNVRQAATGQVTFHGLEKITVPAGTFQAFRYNASIRSEGVFPFVQSTEIWFSPDVEQAVKTIRDGRTQELVSFDIADD